MQSRNCLLGPTDLFFVLFFGALVVDNLHLGSGDQFAVVLSCPFHAALQYQGQEDPGYVQNGLQGIVGELDLVVGAVSGVADGVQALLADGQQLCPHLGLAVEPEVLGIPVAVVHRQVGEVLGPDAVDDGVRVKRNGAIGGKRRLKSEHIPTDTPCDSIR